MEQRQLRRWRRTLRFKAGVSLEGGFWGNVAHAALQQPFMYIMSGITAESLNPTETKKDKVFYEEFAGDLESVMKKSQNDTYYLTVDKFYHQSFTDIALISPSTFAKDMDPVHNVDITRTYVREIVRNPQVDMVIYPEGYLGLEK
nr:hypothetical protein [Paenibacillus sp. MER TA 81-3]